MPARLGQHFLKPGRAAELVDLISPRPSDTFLEIGPGGGALTFDLARRCGRLVAIELDRELARKLSARAEREGVANLVVHLGDALDADFAALVPRGSRLVGNLPYAVSSPLLRRFLDARDLFVDAHLMLQREVAERVASPPGSRDYGVLSVLYALWADVTIVQRLGPEDFSPPPRVDSAVIRVRFRREPRVPVADPEAFADLVRLAFTRRRRTVANNLRLSYPDFKQYLKSAGIAEVRRAETLTVAEFARLAEVLPQKTQPNP